MPQLLLRATAIGPRGAPPIVRGDDWSAAQLELSRALGQGCLHGDAPSPSPIEARECFSVKALTAHRPPTAWTSQTGARGPWLAETCSSCSHGYSATSGRRPAMRGLRDRRTGRRPPPSRSGCPVVLAAQGGFAVGSDEMLVFEAMQDSHVVMVRPECPHRGRLRRLKRRTRDRRALETRERLVALLALRYGESSNDERIVRVLAWRVSRRTWVAG